MKIQDTVARKIPKKNNPVFIIKNDITNATTKKTKDIEHGKAIIKANPFIKNKLKKHHNIFFI